MILPPFFPLYLSLVFSVCFFFPFYLTIVFIFKFAICYRVRVHASADFQWSYAFSFVRPFLFYTSALLLVLCCFSKIKWQNMKYFAYNGKNCTKIEIPTIEYAQVWHTAHENAKMHENWNIFLQNDNNNNSNNSSRCSSSGEQRDTKDTPYGKRSF